MRVCGCAWLCVAARAGPVRGGVRVVWWRVRRVGAVRAFFGGIAAMR